MRKSKVIELVFSGYFWKMIAALVIAVIIYAITCLASAIILKRVLLFDAMQMFKLIGSMMIFYFIFVYVSICNFFKKNIVWLITE